MSKKKNFSNDLKSKAEKLLQKLSKEKNADKEVIKLLQEISDINNHKIETEQFYELFNNIHYGIAIYSPIDSGNNFVFVDFNVTAEKIENIKREKLIGKKVTDVFPDIIKSGLLDVFKRVWKRGIPEDYPISIYSNKKIIGWKDIHVFKLPSGELVASYQDATLQKEAKEKITHSELNLKSLINNRKESIWSIDTEYHFIIFNDFFKSEYYKIHKIHLETGINALDLLTEESYNFWKEKYDKALSGKKFSFEYSAKIGKTLHIYEVSLNPIFADKIVTGVTALSIDITKRRKNEIALKESEEKFKLITQSSLDIIFRIDRLGNFLYLSPSVETILGYKVKDYIGKSFDAIVPKEEVLTYKEKIKEVYSNKELKNFTTKIIHHDGHLVDIEINGKLININGKTIAQGSIRDITERIQREAKLRESEERYHAIFENDKMIMLLVNPDTQNIVDANPGAVQFYGWSREEFCKMKIGQIHTLSAKEIKRKMLKVKKTNNNYFEFKHIKKDGSLVDVSIIRGDIVLNKTDLFYVIVTNITEKKEAEKKAKIREENYKGIFNTSSDAIYIQDRDGFFIDVNMGASKMYGYPIKYFIGKTPEFISAPNKNNLKAIANSVKKAYNGKIQNFEYWGKRKNGEIFPKNVTLYPGVYNGKKVVIAIGRDISERKQAEELIRKSEEQFKNLIQFAPDAFFQGDKNGHFINCNEAASKLTGYSNKELLTMKMGDLFHEDTLIKNPLRYDLLSSGEIIRKERELLRKDGKTIIVEMSSRKMNDETIQSFIRDISERKRAEIAIRESEKNFRVLFEKSPLGTYIATPNGQIVDANPALLKILNSPSLEATKKINVLTFPPLIKNGYSKVFKECIKYNKTLSFSGTYISKWGNEFSYSSYLVPLTNEKGIVEKVYTIMEDITQKKKAEIALRESEEIFRNLSESTSSAIMVYQNNKFVFVNKMTEKLTGYTKAELLKLKFWDVVHPDFKKIVKERGLARQRGKTVKNRYQFKLLRKDGTEIWIDFTAGKIKWAGEDAGIATAFDITDRILAEKRLRESEKRYKLITDSTSDYLFSSSISKEGKVTMEWVSGSFQKITGYSFDEYSKVGGWDAHLHPEDVYIDIEALNELKKNHNVEIEVRIFNKKREIIWLRCSISPQWSQTEKRVISIYGAVKDITEQKNIELALKESEMKYKLITNLTSDYLFSTTIDENGNSILTWLGGSFEKITGYTFEEYKKIGGWRATLHPDDIELDKRSLDILKQNKEVTIEVRTFNKSGKIVWVQSVGSPVWDKRQNKLIGINGACKDITKEKEALLALQDREERYRILSNVTSDYAFEAKLNKSGISELVWVGGSFEKITGYSFDEYNKIGGWRAVIHPDDIEIDDKAFAEAKKNRTVTMEVRTIHKNGKIVWVKALGYPLWNKKENKLIGVLGSVKDITKEKEARIALEEREEKYKLISGITSDYIFESVVDSLGNIETRWVAGSFKKITGYDLVEYNKCGGWLAHLHEDDIAIDKKGLDLLKRNRKATHEVRTYHKDGRIIWVKISCSPIWDNKKNELVGIIGAAKDITQEKQNQLIQDVNYNIANAIVKANNVSELVSKLKKELNKIIDTSNFYVAFYDEKSDMLTPEIFIDENDIVETWSAKDSLSGYLIEQNKKLLVYKKDIETLAKTKKIKIIGTIPEVWLGIPLKVRNKVVGVMAIQSYEKPDAFDKMSIDLFEVIGNQISLYIERNKAKEDALRLSRVVIQSPVSVVITNNIGEIEYVNPMFERITKYSFEEVFGKNPRILKSGVQPKEFYKNLWETILSGNDWKGELLNKKKNDELFWENVIISPIKNEKGTITHFVSIKEDITEKKKMLEELIASKEKAEVSEKIKTEFLAQMSHEIRSPLNVIMSFIGFIKEELNEKMNENLETSFQSIDSASSRIIRTIDLILNMTDLQLGSYDISLSEINIVVILKRIEQEYIQPANKKGLQLILDMEFSSRKIISDEYAITQIISNLVDNAIKYSEKGYIKITAKKLENKGTIIEVKDTGIGIAKDYLPNLFNSFTQEEQGYSRSFDGNGLGMALVKKYCEIIDAKISVVSKKGKGTTFTVIIPNLKMKQ